MWRYRAQSCTRIAVLALLGTSLPWVRADQVLVAELVDDIVASDIVSGGDCHTGCTREVHATAHVSGTPETTSCELETVTPFDTSTASPGLLRAYVYCEDVTGALIEQGTGVCQFEACVDFRWETGTGSDEGQLEYDVVIERTGKPRGAHTVYVDLSVAVDPTAATGAVDSCALEGTCAVTNCTEPTAYMAELALTDTFGDGWVGGLPGHYNLWSIHQVGEEVAVTGGTLADDHESSEVRTCLADGDYSFTTTATKAFSSDMGWRICNEYGVAGEGLNFTVSNGECTSFTHVSRPTAEETDDAEFSYCTLPVASSENDYDSETCTALSSGLKVEGVAMYYDDRCNHADYAGCGARSISGCRLCFVDKDSWLNEFPDARVPEWPECPCCVATVMGMECATDSSSGGTDKALIIGISVGIAGVIAIACCLSCAFGSTILRFFRRLRKRKNGPSLDDMDLDINGAAAFPDSPNNGGTHGHNHTGTRAPVQSGHFPIPRFDSIRGRFDSGIFASTAGGAAVGDKGTPNGGGATAQTTPSGTARGSPNAPRSTVLDDRLVQKGFTQSDIGHSMAGVADRPGSAGSGGGGSTGWGLAMSGEYPDLNDGESYTETGTRRD